MKLIVALFIPLMFSVLSGCKPRKFNSDVKTFATNEHDSHWRNYLFAKAGDVISRTTCEQGKTPSADTCKANLTKRKWSEMKKIVESLATADRDSWVGREDTYVQTARVAILEARRVILGYQIDLLNPLLPANRKSEIQIRLNQLRKETSSNEEIILEFQARIQKIKGIFSGVEGMEKYLEQKTPVLNGDSANPDLVNNAYGPHLLRAFGEASPFEVVWKPGMSLPETVFEDETPGASVWELRAKTTVTQANIKAFNDTYWAKKATKEPFEDPIVGKDSPTESYGITSPVTAGQTYRCRMSVFAGYQCDIFEKNGLASTTHNIAYVQIRDTSGQFQKLTAAELKSYIEKKYEVVQILR